MAGGSGGGKKSSDSSTKQDNTPQLSRAAPSPLGSGAYYGGATPISGFRGASSANQPGNGIGPDGLIHPPQTGSALDQFGMVNAGEPGSPYYGAAAPLPGVAGSPYYGPTAPINSNLKDIGESTAKTNRGLEDANQKLTGIQDGGTRTVGAIDQASNSITSSISNGWTGLKDTISSGLSNLSSAISNIVTKGSVNGGGGTVRGASGGVRGSTASYSSGGSSGGYADSAADSGEYTSLDGYDTGYGTVGSSGDGSAPFESGAPAYNDYGLSDYGLTGGYSNSDTGVGGSTVSDVANQYMSSGGTDYTSSAGFDAGSFAVGGKFTVPGSSNGDKTLVQLHATPGEEVTIVPKGLMTPSSIPVSPLMLNPSSANDNQSVAAQQPAAPIETKVVNMYLHPGVQAEQFLRSRAQIARGM
jgi:hypothetical protein